MKQRIGVLSKDEILFNKLRLLLRESYETILVSSEDEVGSCSIVLADLDTYPQGFHGAITMSRRVECDLRLPFRHEDALEIIGRAGVEGEESISLLSDGRSVLLFGEKIRLTEVEYKLLGVLLSSQERFVKRDVLLNTVWGDGFDPGIVNVYVHYLRCKLEKSGQKIILSSRKEGYGIDEKYRRKV